MPKSKQDKRVGMHAASLDSPILRRILEFLKDGAWRSTLEIQNGAKVCAAGARIAEIRKQGAPISNAWQRKRVFYYRITDVKRLKTILKTKRS